MRGDTRPTPLFDALIAVVHDIARIGGFRSSHKKDCLNLVRRSKLLLPLFEELKDSQDSLSAPALAKFGVLEVALQSAKQLLQFCRDGSKLYLALESEAVMNNFHAVTGDLEDALDVLPWNLLDVSDEVREQVDLVHTQLKRAKERADTQDMELFVDAMIVVSNPRIADTAMLHRLANKLELKTLDELKAETCALQRLIKNEGSEPDESLEQMSIVLKRLRDLSERESSEAETLDIAKLSLSPVRQAENIGCPAVPNDFKCPAVPNDFKCPITLEMMKDPVIIATGQTYERASIQRWLDSGHKTCPKTQQALPHMVLTPNYVLRSLIAQWCEVNGVEVPRRGRHNAGDKPVSVDVPPGDRATIDVLIQKLGSGQTNLQRAAAGELRLLAKRNSQNRVCIAEAGAIPLLVGLLASQDSRTQEHAVTALLNLSIHDCNKGAIVQADAIDPIVGVLKYGSMEARENAAATLFSLSVADENKVTIGASGAIPALVNLLRDGTIRGKKDAATALFNLSIYQGNKPRAVRAGVVEPLMKLLVDPGAGMLDESLAILAILATHQEGRMAIGNASAVPVLVDLIQSGSARNKENSAAVLLALSISDPGHLVTARQLGAQIPLIELAHSGTARARRKASSLLQHLNKPEANIDA